MAKAEPELPSDSDENDEDYVPEGGEDEPLLSEVESDGEAESEPENENDENLAGRSGTRGKGRSKREKKKRGAGQKSGGRTSPARKDEDEGKSIESKLTEEEEKRRADMLWADFTKDAGRSRTAASEPNSTTRCDDRRTEATSAKTEEKIKLTKIYEFAGEEVRVEKEVSATSAEAITSPGSLEDVETKKRNSEAECAPRGRGVKRFGGISTVLGRLGKKAKISTLEKSKLDWNSFKREENLDEEINAHNRGKDGYLERQDFLQRADFRRFEIEKLMRLSRRGAR